jgi:hypothetical protein
MVLSFVAKAEFKVEEGKVMVVGRCQTCFEGLTPELLTASSARHQINNNRVAVAQVKLTNYDGQKPTFSVEKIFAVKTDENGYFLLNNLSADFTYVLLGIQHQENLPVPVRLLAMANAREKQGKLINLGFHRVFFTADAKTGQKTVTTKIDTRISNQHFIDYHISKNPLRKLIGKIKTNNYWGKTNAVSIINSDRVIFSGLDCAEWQS